MVERRGRTRDPLVIHLSEPENDIHAPEEVSVPIPDRVRRPRLPYRMRMLLIAMLALILGGIMWFFWERSSLENIENTPVTAEKSNEITTTIDRIGKLMLLPQDEQPTIANVSDLNALEGQLFFKNAQVGDIVLMYAKAQRAILYSPSRDKIIEVAPITVDLH